MDADVFMTFSDTALPAGFVTKKGKSRGVVMSVPFESLREKTDRDQLMKDILNYFDK